MTPMDSIKGAIILRDLLIARREVAETPTHPPAVPSTALPIFHWLGVAPDAGPGLTKRDAAG